MNKLYFLSLCLVMAFSSTLFAQVYVSPNSYVYVNDRMVFVNQDVNLRPTGRIFLRNEAQLLQGSGTVASANQGAGELSVFQEGTVDNFAYNYWCSPVSNNSALGAGNESFSVSKLHRPTDAMNSTAAVMLGAGVFDGLSSPLRIADRWVFTFEDQITYSQWFARPGNLGPNIAPGLGFTMKGSIDSETSGFSDNGSFNNPGSRQRYDFRGKPNDGSITKSISPGMRTLIGNPYPSAIDLKRFLEDANSTTKTAYFWEQDQSAAASSHLITVYRGGYGSYSPLGGADIGVPYGNLGVYNEATFYAYDGAGTQLAAPTGMGTVFNTRFCPIGQGFMIEGLTVGTYTMANDYRVYIKEGFYSDFNRPNNSQGGTQVSDSDTGFLPEIQSVSGFDYTTVSTAPVPQIKFRTLLNNTGVKTTTLVMIDGASDGVEVGMDAKSPDNSDIDMYFVLDNSQYVISVIDFDINKKVPVGFKANIPANFKIAVGEMINFEEAEHVYLHDKETDVYHEITNAPYEFNVAAGITNNKYEITFVDGQALSIPSLTSEAFGVFQNNDLAQLTIENPSMIDIKTVSLYDIAGKLIFSKTNLGAKTNYQFPTTGIAEAVYIVKIMTTDSQQFAKKITVHYNGK
jgi:hypothetical protein